MNSPASAELAPVLALVGDLVAAVREEQWGDPTPCSSWDVRGLVGHLVAGNQTSAMALHGTESTSGHEPQQQPATDPLGEDPPAAYQDSASALIAAFAEPGALERIVSVPVGEVPGAALLRLRTVETLAHGWDLARATGQPFDPPTDIVAPALAFTMSQLGAAVPRRDSFADAQPVADDAPAMTRLAAFLGRDVS